MTPINLSSGKILLSSIILNNIIYIGNIKSTVYFMYSFVILPIPRAFLIYNCFTAFLISLLSSDLSKVSFSSSVLSRVLYKFISYP